MSACGQPKAEDAAPAGLEELPADLKATLTELLGMDWGKPSAFEFPAVSGTICKKDGVKGFDSAWVKADKVFKDVKMADWVNYNKYLAETLATDKTMKVTENVGKNADGTINSLYVEMKMGAMISNRDAHYEIKKFKVSSDLTAKLGDDCKVDEVTVWRDHPKPKEEKKKVNRMKCLSFCFNFETDKGFRTVDFDNYNFGGSLSNKITNKFVGNKNDYKTIAGYLANVKKNGGKFVA